MIGADHSLEFTLVIWLKVNLPETKDWAVVFLNDRSIYTGWIKEYSFDPDNAYHDFLLARAKRVDENLKEKYVIDGLGVYLNTRDVN